MFEPAMIFILFFVTLGPLKLLGPFAQRTRGLPDTMVHQIAWRAFVIAVAAAIVGGFAGTTMLVKWQVSMPALTLAGGLIFLLVALKIVLQQYEPVLDAPSQPALPASPTKAACSLLFPLILTPYGIAAVISLLSRSETTLMTLTIVAIVMLVMVLNLLTMWFVRKILVSFVPVVLQIVGSVLGVLQVALSVQFIIQGLKALNVLSG